MEKSNEERSKKAEAFICVNTETGNEEEIVNFLQGIDGVEYADIVYGVWDIIAKVSAPTRDALTRLITEDIRGNGFVRSTLTMIVVDSLAT